MKRTAVRLLSWLLLGVLLVQVVRAQTPAAKISAETEQPMARDASPNFLVATIRPSDPDSTGGWGFPTEGHHISCVNATVATIMSVAYGVHIKQIVGGPEWLSKDRYDINGIPDVAGVPDLKQMREMYQKLLADRFHLTFHREQREMPIYAITVTKGGPILKVADPNEDLNTGNSGSGGQRTLRFTNMSMANFALNMNFYEDRPVVDQTALPGRYDFTLKGPTMFRERTTRALRHRSTPRSRSSSVCGWMLSKGQPKFWSSIKRSDRRKIRS